MYCFVIPTQKVCTSFKQFLRLRTNIRNIQVDEWLVLPTSDHEVRGSNPATDGIQLRTVRALLH